jgi:hypothetical protein
MKILSTACLLAFSLSAAAQNAPNASSVPPTPAAPKPVEGIWIFKIGQSSVDVTTQVATELHTQVKLANTSSELFRKGEPAIFELARNTDGAKERPLRAPYCEGTRVFYISEYTIAKRLVLRDVYLTFKNGVLIQLFTEQPAGFLPPFTSVHGQGTRVSKTDSTTCRYAGKPEKRSNFTYVDKWESGSIRAASVQQYYHDQDCQRRKEMFFEVYAQKELTEILTCENQLRAKLAASKQEAERKKLKDLTW